MKKLLLLLSVVGWGCATAPRVDHGLFAAVEAGDPRAFDQSFAEGADVNGRDRGGSTPLHVAAFTRRLAMAELLLGRGADPNASNVEGITPLFLAARRDAVDVAELLLARGAAVDGRTKSGYTPLKAAVEEGNVEMATLLVARGAAVDARDVEGRTALLWAASGLLNRYMATALTPASERARRNMGSSELARMRAALRTVKGQFSEVAALLLEHGADPNVGTGEHQLMRTAAITGDRALAEALLAHGAKVNPGDDGYGAESPLHAALAEGHGDVAELLVAKGADVHARTVQGRTPLHFAVFYLKDRRVIELLLARGADVNARDKEGRTPLAFARAQRRPDLADLLRRHGGLE
jgi:cytohesin